MVLMSGLRGKLFLLLAILADSRNVAGLMGMPDLKIPDVKVPDVKVQVPDLPGISDLLVRDFPSIPNLPDVDASCVVDVKKCVSRFQNVIKDEIDAEIVCKEVYNAGTCIEKAKAACSTDVVKQALKTYETSFAFIKKTKKCGDCKDMAVFVGSSSLSLAVTVLSCLILWL